MGKVLLNCHNGLFWPLKVGGSQCCPFPFIQSHISHLFLLKSFYGAHMKYLSTSQAMNHFWFRLPWWSLPSLSLTCRTKALNIEVPTCTNNESEPRKPYLWDLLLHHHLTSTKSAHLSSLLKRSCKANWTMTSTIVFNFNSPTASFHNLLAWEAAQVPICLRQEFEGEGRSALSLLILFLDPDKGLKDWEGEPAGAVWNIQLKGNYCKVSRDGCVEPSSSRLVQKPCHTPSLGNTLSLKKGPLPCKRGEKANDRYESGDGSLLGLHWSKDVFAFITYSCTLVLHVCLNPPYQLQQCS